MSAKFAIIRKTFRNKGYDVIILDYDVSNKNLSCDSTYIVYVVMWPNFCNSSISIREVNHNLNFIRIWPKKLLFLEEWSWFKFNSLGLALGMTMKFYSSVAKGLKLKVREFCGQSPTFVEVTGERLVGEPSIPSPSPSWIRINHQHICSRHSSRLRMISIGNSLFIRSKKKQNHFKLLQTVHLDNADIGN